MLKRIPVAELRLGMYLHELCGSWMEHPFWRSGFVLDDPQDLQRVIDSGIREAWIDSSRGLDVVCGRAKPESDAAVEREVIEVATRRPGGVVRTTIEEESARAILICQQAKRAVTSMFQDARMGRAIAGSDALPLVEDISNSILRHPGALISMARLKTADDYTYLHSVAVCALMIAVARQFGLDAAQTREAGLAGLLHDIGKAAIPAEILNKPAKLSDEEFAIIKQHPAAGHRMLLGGTGIGDIPLDVCLHHHEKIDGSGYPERLASAQISLFARMGAICDVYDAITSDRPYKRGWDPAEALRKMTEWSPGHFDEKVFQAFVCCVGIYPVGSLVRMQSGRLGVVIEQSEKSLLSPKVKLFYSTRSNVRIAPELLETASPACRDRIDRCEDPLAWNFPDLLVLCGGAQVGT